MSQKEKTALFKSVIKSLYNRAVYNIQLGFQFFRDCGIDFSITRETVSEYAIRNLETEECLFVVRKNANGTFALIY
jgi:hypothetical protein